MDKCLTEPAQVRTAVRTVPAFRFPHSAWVWATLAAMLVSLVLVCAKIAITPPDVDEASLAVPARNLAQHGFPGTTTFVEKDTPWKGINRRTYNTLPGGILYLASWFAYLPATTLATRIAMSLWAPVLLAAYFVLIRRLTGNVRFAVLSMVLFCLEYTFVLAAARARVDLMAASLGITGLASYCEFRLRSLSAAVFVSSMLVVFSSLTHPEGVIYAICLLTLAVCLDRRSLSPAHVAIAAIPLLTCGTLWLWYVAQDPAGAVSQLRVNSLGWGRFPKSYNPIEAIHREIFKRYLKTEPISIGHTWIPKLVLLLIPLGCGAGILMTRFLRRQSGIRLILLLTAEVLILQTVFENSKSHEYLIHTDIFYCALMGTFGVYAWRAGRWRRLAVALALATFILMNLGVVAWRLRRDIRNPGFRSALAFLQKRVSPRDLVIANTQFWFGCPGHNLVDDTDAGLRSGLLPDYFVDQGQSAPTWSRYLQKAPARFLAVQARLTRYEVIYDYRGFRIYHLRSRTGT